MTRVFVVLAIVISSANELPCVFNVKILLLFSFLQPAGENQVWRKPSLEKTKFGEGQVWRKPSLEKTKSGEGQLLALLKHTKLRAERARVDTSLHTQDENGPSPSP